jgi:hypothetical protein
MSLDPLSIVQVAESRKLLSDEAGNTLPARKA